MFGYRERITYEEYKNWKQQYRQGILPDPPSKEDLPTELLPRNVEAEEAIRMVLLLNPLGGMMPWRCPLDQLDSAWQKIYPEEICPSSVASKAGLVVSALNAASDKKMKDAQKPKEQDNG